MWALLKKMGGTYTKALPFRQKGKNCKKQDFKSPGRSRESRNYVYNTDIDVTGVVRDYRNWK